jgi:hypothetical protein
MANAKTDSLGLKKSPVNPQTAEVAPNSTGSKLMGIFAPGGDPVRATHPGRVQSIIKTPAPGARASSFIVVLAATENETDNSGRTPDDPNVNLSEFPNTVYAGLGSISVQVGEKVSTGTQIGTVGFFPTHEGVGGKTGITYGVNQNGLGSEAARLAPQGYLAIKAIDEAQLKNTENETPDTENTKEEPTDADTNTPGLNQVAAQDNSDNPPTLAQVGNSNFPYVTRPQVRFVEQSNQVFSHDLLVYISGVDVTPYLAGQVSINIVDKDGWNEANLTLNNAMNNFIITQDNIGFNNDLKGVFRTGESQGERKYSEQAKKDLIEYKNELLRNPLVDIEKLQLVDPTVTQGVAQVSVSGNRVQQISNATGNQVAPVKGEAKAPKRDRASKTTFQVNPGIQDRRWQLGYMSAVFHKHDPIRIFRKNPIREQDEWMPAFTGYLNEISYDTNYINGQSQVSLSCYDIRALAAKMRVQETAVTGVTNPRALFQGSEQAGASSLFTDLLNPTVQGHPLQAKRYEDVMEFLITGTSSEESNLQASFGASKFRRGIGDFTVGDKIFYRPGSSVSSPKIAPDPLEHWHALCLFGTAGARHLRVQNGVPGTVRGKEKTILKPDPSGLPSLNRRWMTEAEARAIGKATTNDGEWAPHKQFVHFLLPADGTGAKNLLEADVANVDSNQIDFRSRLDIMQDFSARIDYQFWVTPMGDFVVEFPQYDFHPEDYGEYSTVFRVDKHLTSDTIQDEAGDMVTAIIASGRIRPEGEASIPEFIQPKAVVVSPMMMMRYGVLEHELTLPFVSSTDSLARLAQIEFQKKLSESNKMNMSFNYRPWITPNRPIEHMERKRMGLTTAVHNSMTIFKEADTSITTRYVRRQIFRNDGTAAYTFIFSGASMPITYREIYANSTIVPSTGKAGQVTLQKEPTNGGRAGNSNTAITDNPNVNITQGAVQNTKTVDGLGTAARSPTPSKEQAGVFMAIAQQSSGWNELNRTTDGRFGLFGLSKEQRIGLGIGDSTDAQVQADAADGYFKNLVSKWKGDLFMATAEFREGAEAIKNNNILQDFKDGFWATTEKLGKKFETVAQSLKEEYSELRPGDKESTKQAPTDAATKEAIAAAETAQPLPSGAGYQNTVGVIVYTKQDSAATSSTTVGATHKQAEENAVTNRTATTNG